MSNKEIVVLSNEDGDWVVPLNIFKRIKKGEDFLFNARLKRRLNDDSLYMRCWSLDEKFEHIRKEKI